MIIYYVYAVILVYTKYTMMNICIQTLYIKVFFNIDKVYDAKYCLERNRNKVYSDLYCIFSCFCLFAYLSTLTPDQTIQSTTKIYVSILEYAPACWYTFMWPFHGKAPIDLCILKNS